MQQGPRPVWPPSVWWGDADSVQRLHYWQQRRKAEDLPPITHVCNVAANGVPLQAEERHEDVTYMDIRMLDVRGDEPGTTIWTRNERDLRAAVDFIEETVQSKGIVLVNCHMGQNRSGAVLLAWLLTHRTGPNQDSTLGFNPERAMRHLRQIEPEAVNNDSLRRLAMEVAGASLSSKPPADTSGNAPAPLGWLLQMPRRKSPSPEPGKKNDLPIQELYAYSGHWIWERDEGLDKLLDVITNAPNLSWGHLSFCVREPRPEEWYSLTMSEKILVKRTDSNDVSGTWNVTLEPNGQTTNLGGVDIRMFVEDGTRTKEEWKGVAPSTNGFYQMHYLISREVVNGELVVTWVNRELAPQATVRTFYRRFPCFSIENFTGQVVTMSTYPPDLSYFTPRALYTLVTKELDHGINHVDASSVDSMEEVAVFTMPDGRSYEILIRPFETVSLDDSCFGGYGAEGGFIKGICCGTSKPPPRRTISAR